MRFLTHLERLHVTGCGSIKEFSNINQELRKEGDVNIHIVAFPSNLYLHSLCHLELSKCEGVDVLFEHLHRINIQRCHDIEEVVSKRYDDNDKDEEEMSNTSTTITFFPRLHSLIFKMLANLKCIGGGGGQANATKISVFHDQVGYLDIPTRLVEVTNIYIPRTLVLCYVWGTNTTRLWRTHTTLMVVDVDGSEGVVFVVWSSWIGDRCRWCEGVVFMSDDLDFRVEVVSGFGLESFLGC
ncbi:hypothetical protein E3N88_00037 [Mikania micrantha]|uniref:Uncharacterized protein n=1 Tax=Mikania micrantha TaxID=192012 RepID=A0A5N6PYY9_9ASTR|nr:hypothetical protein E3N88_00037 [Mikania micrantha]